MKKIINKIMILIMLVITICSISSCNTSESDPETFDDYSDLIFKTLFNGDELSMNFFFENPESFGLVHPDELSLPTPGTTSILGTLIFNISFGNVKSYDYNKLNFDQQMTYNVIVNLLDTMNKKIPEMSYLSNDYLGSYLGYQAQLPLLLMRYNLRNKMDVDNYFRFIDLIPETFTKYVDYEIEKAEKGYGMPDFVIDKVIGQCESFLTDIDNNDDLHFMITSMNERIDSLDFLTSEEKATYKELNISKVRGSMALGYNYIKNHLGEIKGKAINNQGLAHYVLSDGYEIGKEYYKIAFLNATGYDENIEDVITYIDNIIANSSSEIEQYREYNANHPEFKEKLSSIKLMDDDILEQLKYYQNAINGYYPTIDSEYNINIEYVAEAMEDYFSPAAYMISPIDNHENEFIYLNRSSIYIDKLNTDTGEMEKELDYNYLATTLAHEGVPGHLYQNVYFKNQDVNTLRKVLRSSGYMEGWAVYSEQYVYQLLKENTSDELTKKVIDYLSFQDTFNGAIYSRLDLGIHYEGWSIEQTYDFLKQYLNITLESTQSLYERLVEVPTNSQTYYYTYFRLMDLRKYAETIMGDEFDELEFNTMILQCGPVPLRFVEEYVRSYYDQK